LVRTSRGQALAYDELLICTGGLPIVPAMPGLDLDGVFTFSRLGDADRLLDRLDSSSARSAVVVGGGMIGIKVTDALLKRGLAVTMVELSPRILSAALDETGSLLATRLLQAAGVTVHTEDTVTEIGGSEGRLTGVRLKRAGEVACDALVFGIGVRPNADLARAAGIKVNRGIVVDALMRTSAEDVYAAGDVAEAFDLVVDMNRTVAIWPNAYRQGRIAGADMVGVGRPDRGGVAMNALEVAGVPFMAIGNGNVSGEGYEVAAELDDARSRYRRLVLRGDRLVGAILVGQIDRAGIYTGLIRNKIDIGPHRRKLLDGSLSLFTVPDQYRKHIVTGAAVEV
jgi:NAD(P)H-nitrite reductase large subunit